VYLITLLLCISASGHGLDKTSLLHFFISSNDTERVLSYATLTNSRRRRLIFIGLLLAFGDGFPSLPYVSYGMLSSYVYWRLQLRNELGGI